MISFKFDTEKAIASILFVTQGIKAADIEIGLHKLFKILYFADQKHMAEYGRPIVGDHYIAMNYGPVPSNIYDILKSVRGDSRFIDGAQFAEYFDVYGHQIDPKQQPDLEVLSESEIECLTDALNENKELSFGDLVTKSHDAAYTKAAKDDKISFREMAKAIGATHNMLSYMNRVAENHNIFHK